MDGIRPLRITSLEASAAMRHDLDRMEFRHTLEQYGIEEDQNEEDRFEAWEYEREEDEGGEE